VSVHAGPIGLAVAYQVAPVTVLAMIWLHVHRHLFRVAIKVDFPRYRVLLSESGLLSWHQVTSAARSKAEQLLVPKLVGVGAFGYFAAGTIIPERLLVVPDGFATAYYPAVARAHTDPKADPSEHVSHFLLVSLIVCTPIAILVTFLSGPIAAILFPHHAETCREVMRISIW